MDGVKVLASGFEADEKVSCFWYVNFCDNIYTFQYKTNTLFCYLHTGLIYVTMYEMLCIPWLTGHY